MNAIMIHVSRLRYALSYLIVALSLFSGCDSSEEGGQAGETHSIDDGMIGGEQSSDMGGIAQLEDMGGGDDIIPLSPRVEGSCGSQYVLELNSSDGRYALRGRLSSTDLATTCHSIRGLNAQGALIELRPQSAGRYLLTVEHEVPVAVELRGECAQYQEQSADTCVLPTLGNNQTLADITLTEGQSTYVLIERLYHDTEASNDFTIRLNPVSSERMRVNEARAYLSDDASLGSEQGMGAGDKRLAVKMSGEGISRGLSSARIVMSYEGGEVVSLPPFSPQEFKTFSSSGDHFEALISGLIAGNMGPLSAVSISLIDALGVESDPLTIPVEAPPERSLGEPCDHFGLSTCEAPLICDEASADQQAPSLVCQVLHTPELLNAEVALGLDQVTLGFVIEGNHKGLTTGDALNLKVTLTSIEEGSREEAFELLIYPDLDEDGDFVIYESFSFFRELFDVYGAYNDRVHLQLIDERGVTSQVYEAPVSPVSRCNISQVLSACESQIGCLSDLCTVACTSDAFEPLNNRPESAPPLDLTEEVSVEGTICGSDHDFYQLTLTSQSELTLTLTDFDSRVVTLLMTLYNEQGELLVSSSDRSLYWRNSSTMSERFFVQVKAINPPLASRYTLHASQAERVGEPCYTDPYEINNDISRATPWSISAQLSQEDSLTLCGDPDFFEVQLAPGESASAYADVISGELVGAVYDQSRYLLGRSFVLQDQVIMSVTNVDVIPQSYYFELISKSNEDAEYWLSIEEGLNPCIDEFEPNNESPEATGWANLSETSLLEALSLCGDDVDRFSFDLEPGASLSVTVNVNEANVELEGWLGDSFQLFDNGTQAPLVYENQSDRAMRVELELMLSYNNDESAMASYSIFVTQLNPTCQADPFEPNDLIEQASLWPTDETVLLERASLCDDEDDYYWLSLTPNELVTVEGKCATSSTQSLAVELYSVETGRALSSCADYQSEATCAEGCVWRLGECLNGAQQLSYTNQNQGDEDIAVRVYAPNPVEGSSCAYQLKLSANSPLGCEDRYEPNDELAEAVPRALTDLIQIGEEQSLCFGDKDVYEVRISPRSAMSLEVRRAFDSTFPRVELINEAGLAIESAQWTFDQTKVFMLINPNQIPVTAYIRVSYLPHIGAEQMTYMMEVNERSIDQCDLDLFEPNDQITESTPYERSRSIKSSDVLIACQSAPDYYEIELQPEEELTAFVRYVTQFGDISLTLLSADGTTLATSRDFEFSNTLFYRNQTSGVLSTYIYVDVHSLAQNAASTPYMMSISTTLRQCTGDSFEPNDSLIDVTDHATVQRRDADTLTGEASLNLCSNDLDVFPIELEAGESLNATVSPSAEQVGFFVSAELYLDLSDVPVDRSAGTAADQIVQYTNQTESTQLIYLKVQDQPNPYFDWGLSGEFGIYTVALDFTDEPPCEADRFEDNDDLSSATPASETMLISPTEELTSCGYDVDCYELLVPAESSVDLRYQSNDNIATLTLYLPDSEALTSIFPELTYENRSSEPELATLCIDARPAVESIYHLTIETSSGLCADPFEPNDEFNIATTHASRGLITLDDLLTLCDSDDRDLYEIILEPSEVFTATLSNSDPEVYMFLMHDDFDLDLLSETLSFDQIIYTNTTTSQEVVYLGVNGYTDTYPLSYHLETTVVQP